MKLLNKIIKHFNNDLAIDLGTANTLVCSPGGEVILNEPSVVAVQRDFHNQIKVVAVGKEAKTMLGRTPGGITAVRPIKDGVIADFEITQKNAEILYFKIRGNGPAVYPSENCDLCALRHHSGGKTGR